MAVGVLVNHYIVDSVDLWVTPEHTSTAHPTIIIGFITVQKTPKHRITMLSHRI